jgi:hypothetical protein
MLTTKSSPEKRIFDWQEQQQVNIEKEIVDFNVQLFFSLSLSLLLVLVLHINIIVIFCFGIYI